MSETLKEVDPGGFFSSLIITKVKVKVFWQELQLKLSLYPPHKGFFFKKKTKWIIRLMSFWVWNSFLHTLTPIIFFSIPLGRSFISPPLIHLSTCWVGLLPAVGLQESLLFWWKMLSRCRLTISSCLLESDFGATLARRLISRPANTHTHIRTHMCTVVQQLKIPSHTLLPTFESAVTTNTNYSFIICNSIPYFRWMLSIR